MALPKFQLPEFQRAQIDTAVNDMVAMGVPREKIQEEVNRMVNDFRYPNKQDLEVGRWKPVKPPLKGPEDIVRGAREFVFKHPGAIAATLASLAPVPGVQQAGWMRALPVALRALRAAQFGTAGELVGQEVGELTGDRPERGPQETLTRGLSEGAIQTGAQLGGEAVTGLLGQLGKAAMRTGFRMVDEQQLGKVWDTALRERIAIGAFKGEKGSKKVMDMIGDQGAFMDRVLTDMMNQGHRLTRERVGAVAISRLQEQLREQGQLPLTAQEASKVVDDIWKTFDDVLTEINKDVPRTTMATIGGRTTPIATPMEAQRVKQELSVRLKPEIKAQRELQLRPERLEGQRMEDLAAGLKETLEGIPLPPTARGQSLEEINRRTSELINLKEGLLAAEKYKTPFLSRYAAPYVLAGMGAGAVSGDDTQERLQRAGVGGLGGLVGAGLFMGSTSPRVLSRLGLWLTDPAMQRFLYQQLGRVPTELLRPQEPYKF